jgi:nucleotide-binding universal stress UspA family protein
MYKHILIPTDGSEMSARAIAHGIELAKRLNAKVTGLAVISPWDDVAFSIKTFDIDQAQYERNAEAYAASSLLVITNAAKAAEVACSVVQMKESQPWTAIIDTARLMHCDLILMASHGRSGIGALIIGSETQKVLTHSTRPVLVYRDTGCD